MSASLMERFGHPTMMLAATWLFGLSAVVLIDHNHWRHLTSSMRANTLARDLNTLQARVDSFESQLTTQKGQPVPVSVERFSETSHSLDERLTHLEQEEPHRASQQDVDILASRVSTLEASRAHSARAASIPPPPNPAANASPPPAEPPFRLLGVEMRGGESFLAIAPPRAVSLTETSVLRVGDVQDGWLLQALDSKAATFEFQGQPRRLEVP